MPYRFLPEDHTLQSALRRIAGDEIASALAHLAAPGPIAATGVHDVRKRVKKLRGLLRLLRPGFEDFAEENAALRDAARSLSGLRDAEVRLATFNRIFPETPAALADLRQQLKADRETSGDGHGTTGDAHKTLLALHQRARHWHLRGKDQDILTEGLARTRARARASLALAAETPTIEAMHDWRKRAKDHWYQARLFTPVWPEILMLLADAAGSLTEDLGDHHDLGVLALDVASRHSAMIDAAAMDLFTTRITGAQHAIEARVFPLGQRLFADDPKAMAKLWVRWWRVWRD